MKKLLAKGISAIFLLRYRLFYKGRVRLGKGVIANWRLKIKGPGKVLIADNVNLWSFAETTSLLTFAAEAVIEIGSGSRLNGACLQARESIKIGENCLIGSALIMDNDFHNSHPFKRFDKSMIPTAPVKIGDNVWLAGQCVILKGVEVGKNSTVAIRAVVSKNVPENSVAAGNPAKIVKEFYL